MQKAINSGWLAEIDQIYQQYTIYYQAEGSEQLVFADGAATARSDRLVQCLTRDEWVKQPGRLLDVGYGNGALLRAFSQRLPGWTLAGTELTEKYKGAVEKIPGVERLYTCPPSEVPGLFDLITMVHVLEHIPDPGEWLIRLSTRLAPQGRVLIEVPTYIRNPFDLLIADHSTHFTPETLRALLERVGYAVDAIPTDWVPRELSMIVHVSFPPVPGEVDMKQPVDYEMAKRAVNWLQQVINEARDCAVGHPLGIFGTSIAATWLCSEVDECVSFFVDEDPKRIGRSHMGRPIYHPRDVPAAAAIFVAMPTLQAEELKVRLERTYATLHLAIPQPLDLHPGVD